jgi:hypothetical protein
MGVDLVEAYQQLNSRFIELAEEGGHQIAPVLGRSINLVEQGEPLYTEICGDRFISIYQESCELDPQWNGLINLAHLQVFADVRICSAELLWKIRCAWLDFRVSPEQAEEQVFKIVEAARAP